MLMIRAGEALMEEVKLELLTRTWGAFSRPILYNLYAWYALE